MQGGTSGIGVTAIQLARAFGATVIATAGSDEMCGLPFAGRTTPSTTKSQDFVAEVKRITEARGVDVVLDMVAGTMLPAKSIAWPRMADRHHRRAGRAERISMQDWCCASASHHHGVYIASASRGVQGRHCTLAARACLGPLQRARSVRSSIASFAAAGRRTSPCADGVQPAHRQDCFDGETMNAKKNSSH